MPQNNNVDRKQVIKLCVAAVLIIVAIILTIRSCTGTDKLSLETHRSPYICMKCGYVAEYTRAKRNELIEKAAAGPSDLFCEECKNGFMRSAIGCKNCGKVYPLVVTFSIEQGRTVAPCPECGMSPAETTQGKVDDK